MIDMDPEGPWVYFIGECWTCGAIHPMLAPVLTLRHGLQCATCGFMAQYPRIEDEGL